MIEDQALVLIELGHYQKAQDLLKESEQIHAKVGVKPDANYLAPRLKLAIAKGDVDDAAALLDRQFGPIPNSLSWSVPLMLNMESRAELALLRDDGKSATAIAHRLAGLIDSAHQQPYLRAWLVRALLVEGQGRLLDRDPSGALPLLEQAVKREAEMLDPSSPELAKTDALLGIAYLDLGRRNNAEELFSKARLILRTHQQLSDRYLRAIHELGQRLDDRSRQPSKRTAASH